MACQREIHMLRRYSRQGLFAGALVGLLVGVLVAGPNFYYWAAGQSSLVVFGSMLLGAVLSRLATGLALAFMSGGAAGEESFSESRPIATSLSGTMNPNAEEQVTTTVEGE
jgi:hypothetical protein